MAEANVTTDHEFIRRWAEERGGRPATVRRTHGDDDVGIIRIDFPDPGGDDDKALEPISWEEFFEKFDEKNLALLYQEQTADGQQSRFNKLVSRETAEKREQDKGRR